VLGEGRGRDARNETDIFNTRLRPARHANPAKRWEPRCRKNKRVPRLKNDAAALREREREREGGGRGVKSYSLPPSRARVPLISLATTRRICRVTMTEVTKARGANKERPRRGDSHRGKTKLDQGKGRCSDLGVGTMGTTVRGYYRTQTRLRIGFAQLRARSPAYLIAITSGRNYLTSPPSLARGDTRCQI